MTEDQKKDLYWRCAEMAHEANRSYCAALGDHSQMPWGEAPQWQRESCYKGVVGVLENGNTPEQSHESWLKEKEETGWKYGKVKNPETKEHPCMVPYAELPEEQRVKDKLFVNIVNCMAKSLGWLENPS